MLHVLGNKVISTTRVRIVWKSVINTVVRSATRWW